MDDHGSIASIATRIAPKIFAYQDTDHLARLADQEKLDLLYFISRKNIHAHYDLGNAFYTLWLKNRLQTACLPGDISMHLNTFKSTLSSDLRH